MKTKITLFLLLAAALVGGCKNSTTVEDNDLGTLRGKVAFSDAICDPIANASGATIKIEGTGFSAVTDSSGQWEIDNVPAGIYNIIISKPGFDTNLIAEFEFNGAGTQFLENDALYASLMDSIVVSSVHLTNRDSIAERYKNDTVLDSRGVLDSIIYDVKYEDTVGFEYFLKITYIEHGPDSAINFSSSLKDVNRTYNGESFAPFAGHASKSMSAEQDLNWFSGTGLQSFTLPGDTLIVSTSVSTCRGQGSNAFYTFVLP